MPEVLTAKAPNAPPDTPGKRNRERTLHELNLALLRVQHRGDKVTLKAVADEANVSPPLINNRYTDFAEQVRASMGKAIRQQRNEKADLLVKERDKSRQFRDEMDKLLLKIKRLAFVNEALRNETGLYKAIYDGKVAQGAFKRKDKTEKP
jgi:AcrR family transcriptional regulator